VVTFFTVQREEEGDNGMIRIQKKEETGYWG
jgi:hypothetical protein